ncbi:hypothetical protein FNF29_03539 [Cafeteria roenbergensis]|uniref:Uncharacterized protein n=1 Tax=Cafeteria roenbergensis TaxID=33653 RepID=A0A5A8CJY6_CAFRO|nr:hypothetical protein FNF29_03539 [Cafeteria roenbergensis]|eukprot:KAA0153019.1 hypothetical protein FNF29_03539 [Cafeteria roenbergensis]
MRSGGAAVLRPALRDGGETRTLVSTLGRVSTGREAWRTHDGVGDGPDDDAEERHADVVWPAAFTGAVVADDVATVTVKRALGMPIRHASAVATAHERLSSGLAKPSASGGGAAVRLGGWHTLAGIDAAAVAADAMRPKAKEAARRALAGLAAPSSQRRPFGQGGQAVSLGALGDESWRRTRRVAGVRLHLDDSEGRCLRRHFALLPVAPPVPPSSAGALGALTSIGQASIERTKAEDDKETGPALVAAAAAGLSVFGRNPVAAGLRERHRASRAPATLAATGPSRRQRAVAPRVPGSLTSDADGHGVPFLPLDLPLPLSSGGNGRLEGAGAAGAGGGAGRAGGARALPGQRDARRALGAPRRSATRLASASSWIGGVSSGGVPTAAAGILPVESRFWRLFVSPDASAAAPRDYGTFPRLRQIGVPVHPQLVRALVSEAGSLSLAKQAVFAARSMRPRGEASRQAAAGGADSDGGVAHSPLTLALAFTACRADEAVPLDAASLRQATRLFRRGDRVLVDAPASGIAGPVEAVVAEHHTDGTYTLQRDDEVLDAPPDLRAARVARSNAALAGGGAASASTVPSVGAASGSRTGLPLLTAAGDGPGVMLRNVRPSQMRPCSRLLRRALQKASQGFNRVALLASLHALHDDANCIEALRLACPLLLAMSRPAECAGLAHRLCQLRPHELEGHLFFGLASVALGRLRSAIFHLRCAVRTDPTCERALKGLWEAEAKMRMAVAKRADSKSKRERGGGAGGGASRVPNVLPGAAGAAPGVSLRSNAAATARAFVLSYLRPLGDGGLVAFQRWTSGCHQHGVLYSSALGASALFRDGPPPSFGQVPLVFRTATAGGGAGGGAARGPVFTETRPWVTPVRGTGMAMSDLDVVEHAAGHAGQRGWARASSIGGSTAYDAVSSFSLANPAGHSRSARLVVAGGVASAAAPLLLPVLASPPAVGLATLGKRFVSALPPGAGVAVGDGTRPGPGRQHASRASRGLSLGQGRAEASQSGQLDDWDSSGLWLRDAAAKAPDHGLAEAVRRWRLRSRGVKLWLRMAAKKSARQKRAAELAASAAARSAAAAAATGQARPQPDASRGIAPPPLVARQVVHLAASAARESEASATESGSRRRVGLGKGPSARDAASVWAAWGRAKTRLAKRHMRDTRRVGPGLWFHSVTLAPGRAEIVRLWDDVWLPWAASAPSQGALAARERARREDAIASDWRLANAADAAELVAVGRLKAEGMLAWLTDPWSKAPVPSKAQQQQRMRRLALEAELLRTRASVPAVGQAGLSARDLLLLQVREQAKLAKARRSKRLRRMRRTIDSVPSFWTGIDYNAAKTKGGEAAAFLSVQSLASMPRSPKSMVSASKGGLSPGGLHGLAAAHGVGWAGSSSSWSPMGPGIVEEGSASSASVVGRAGPSQDGLVRPVRPPLSPSGSQTLAASASPRAAAVSFDADGETAGFDAGQELRRGGQAFSRAVLDSDAAHRAREEVALLAMEGSSDSGSAGEVKRGPDADVGEASDLAAEEQHLLDVDAEALAVEVSSSSGSEGLARGAAIAPASALGASTSASQDDDSALWALAGPSGTDTGDLESGSIPGSPLLRARDGLAA